MRAVNRNLKKVYFHSTGNTPYVHSIAPGVERVTWNTDPEQRITGEQTQPAPRRRHSQPLDVLYL